MATSGHNGDPQPFSLEELENFTGDWVLSSDMRLLSNFKSLSNSMFERADRVFESLNQVAYSAEEKSVKVSNIINNLQALATNQFIENRVYDESEGAVMMNEEPPADQQQNMISKIRSSLNKGLQFVGREFPVRDVDEDSDEEENIRHSIQSFLRSNRFHSRKLPPLVGGQEFARENFVSLSRCSGSLETAADAVDAVAISDQQYVSDAMNQPLPDQEDETRSGSDIVISSDSDSDDMFANTFQPVNTTRRIESHLAENIFSDSRESESGNIFDVEPQIRKKVPTTFQDELNRRLGVEKRSAPPAQPVVAPEVVAVTDSSSRSSTLSQQRDAPTGSRSTIASVSSTDKRTESKAKVPHVAQDKVRTDVEIDDTKNRTSSMLQNPLDFLSDDEDDEFDIFKNISTKPKQPVKTSRLFDSEDSEPEKRSDRLADRKPLAAKDSKDTSHPSPQKEVRDVALAPHAKQRADDAVKTVKPTASLFSDEEEEDDLFVTKSDSVFPASRTAIITSAKGSDDNRVQESRVISQSVPAPAPHVEPDSSSDSDLSSSEMSRDRGSIADKLEKSILGNQSRKPVGGISLFGGSQLPARKPATSQKPDPVSSEKSATKTTALPVDKTSSEKKQLIRADSNDNELFPGSALNAAETLSSQVVKSRPKAPARRKPTRTALKTAATSSDMQSDSQTQIPKSVSPLLRLSTVDASEKSDAKSEAAPAPLTAPVTTNTASIKSDRKESISETTTGDGKKAMIITSSDKHHAKTNKTGSVSQSKAKEREESSVPASAPDPDSKKTRTASLLSKKSVPNILSDDSDEDLFASSAAKKSPAEPKKQIVAQKPAPEPVAVAVKKSSLFSDSEEDEDDLFAKIKKPVVKPQVPVASTSLFDSDESPGEPAVVKPKPKPATVPAVASVATKKPETSQKKGLFSDDSEEEDLFGPKKK